MKNRSRWTRKARGEFFATRWSERLSTAIGCELGASLATLPIESISRSNSGMRNNWRRSAGWRAGWVAHDFNNILSIIMGHAQLLLATGVEERSRTGLEQMQRAAERAASLTQQLLAFSRKQVLQPKVLDLNESVTDVEKMLSRVIGEDIELIAKLHPSLMMVKADPSQLEQVLINLAVNARDAMPQGGKLSMQTSNVELQTDEARDLDLAPGFYVMLTVSDTGNGMDPVTL